MTAFDFKSNKTETISPIYDHEICFWDKSGGVSGVAETFMVDFFVELIAHVEIPINVYLKLHILFMAVNNNFN